MKDNTMDLFIAAKLNKTKKDIFKRELIPRRAAPVALRVTAVGGEDSYCPLDGMHFRKQNKRIIFVAV